MNEYFLIKHLRGKEYAKFIKKCLQTGDHVLASCADYAENEFPVLGEAEKDVPKELPSTCYISVLNQKQTYYAIDYHRAMAEFEKFDSLSDFLRRYDVRGMWFFKDDGLTVHIFFECNEAVFYNGENDGFPFPSFKR